MKITNKWLKKNNACLEGISWFEDCGETYSVAVIEKLISQEKLEWANWLISNLLDRKGQIKFAVFSAQQVIDIFEKKFPNDKRPRKAINAAIKVLKDNSEINGDAWAAEAAGAAALDARDAARDAAWDAARAARAAALAAGDAAWAAGAAALDAGDAARAAALDAGDAWAARAAAGNVMKIKIICYGIELLKSGGNK